MIFTLLELAQEVIERTTDNKLNNNSLKPFHRTPLKKNLNYCFKLLHLSEKKFNIIFFFVALEVSHKELEPPCSDPSRLHGLHHIRPGCSSTGTLPAQTWEVSMDTILNLSLLHVNPIV